MQPKICFVTTGDIRVNATAKRALGMARPLDGLGWKVAVVLEDTAENRHRAALECGDATELVFFRQHSATDEIRTKSAIVARLHPDVLYISAPVVRNMVTAPRGCRRVVEHSELASHNADVHGLMWLKVMAMELWSRVQADALVCASRYLMDIFGRRAHRMLCRTPRLYLPYAYNTTVCHPMVIDRTTVADGRYAGRWICCYMGSLTDNYGALTMTDAIDRLRSSHPEVLLILMGRGDAEDEVRRRIRERGMERHIMLTGYVSEEEIDFYFSLADAFISPMHDTPQDWARCPSKLYMYLPYDHPIVTCRVGEPLATLGDKGVYYQPGDADDMAHQIGKLIDSGATRLGIDASHHTWQARAEVFDRWIRKETGLCE